MDNVKIGRLIASKRKERKMTQRELGLKINVSDKTISKWESGLGMPDISCIESLADVLGLNVNEILSGDVNINDNDMANMKKTKFYFCGKCGNIIASTNNVTLSCCGQKLTELSECNSKAVENDGNTVDNDKDIDKNDIKVEYIELYPEQDACTRFKRSGHGIIYVLCNKHGLVSKRI